MALIGTYDPGGSSGFGSVLVPHLAVERRLHRTLWLRGEAEYQSYGAGRGITARRADWVPIGIGLRWQDVSAVGIGAYLDFHPTLFGFRWSGALSNYEVGERYREWTRLVPGLTTGFGLQFRPRENVAMSYGLRLHRSAQPVEELRPLEQLMFVMGLAWGPRANP